MMTKKKVSKKKATKPKYKVGYILEQNGMYYCENQNYTVNKLKAHIFEKKADVYPNDSQTIRKVKYIQKVKKVYKTIEIEIVKG